MLAPFLISDRSIDRVSCVYIQVDHSGRPLIWFFQFLLEQVQGGLKFPGSCHLSKRKLSGRPYSPARRSHTLCPIERGGQACSMASSILGTRGRRRSRFSSYHSGWPQWPPLLVSAAVAQEAGGSTSCSSAMASLPLGTAGGEGEVTVRVYSLYPQRRFRLYASQNLLCRIRGLRQLLASFYDFSLSLPSAQLKRRLRTERQDKSNSFHEPLDFSLPNLTHLGEWDPIFCHLEVTAKDGSLFIPLLHVRTRVGIALFKNIFLTLQLFINHRLVDSSPLKRALEMVYSAYLPKAIN